MKWDFPGGQPDQSPCKEDTWAPDALMLDGVLVDTWAPGWSPLQVSAATLGDACLLMPGHIL